jgi:hypothetical protein
MVGVLSLALLEGEAAILGARSQSQLQSSKFTTFRAFKTSTEFTILM